MSGTARTKRLMAVDSHTGGEPTRVIVAGGPRLSGGNGASGASVAEQLEVLRREHDWLRRATMNEPRGNDVLVGGLLVPAAEAGCVAGVIYFNNVGYLGMCGHGTVGLIATLAHLGWVEAGEHRIETAVGVVTTTLHADGSVSVANVPSRREKRGVAVEVEGVGRVTGDVAWGGNWFYLVDAGELAASGVRVPPIDVAYSAGLTELTSRIRRAVNAKGYPLVDHVELFGEPTAAEGAADADSRNFVLCPGLAYDRSACGTGTSAKLACLAADGKLDEGEPWVQQSVVASVMTGRYRWIDRAAGVIAPTITASAYVTAELTLVIDAADPFRHGIAPPEASAAWPASAEAVGRG